MDSKLTGRVAFITGAGRGIGRATALKFAEAGAKVALISRTADELASLAREMEAAGGSALAVPTDISDERQVAAAVAETEARFGPVDILVNNAGVMMLRSLAETSVEDWNRLMNTNVLGAFLCARAVLPSMKERRSGRIINIGSLAGRRGYPEQGAYCTSKHALVGLSKVLAIECKDHGIRVNMVSPGGVLTGLSEELLGSRGTAQADEWMTAGEVADAVYYIAAQDGVATTDELVLRRFASEPWR